MVGVAAVVAALASVPAFAFQNAARSDRRVPRRQLQLLAPSHGNLLASRRGRAVARRQLQQLELDRRHVGEHRRRGVRCRAGAIKTLQDRPVLLPAQRVTIHYLVTRPAPSYLPYSRLPFERHVFTVTGSVALIWLESDSDFHVVLTAGRDEMIIESPGSSCDSRAFPVRRHQMTIARNHIQSCSRAPVTGVAFFDFNHGQTGVAPNAIELHPIAFRCLA